MPDDRIPMTQGDFEQRKVDLERLHAKLREVTQQVATARDMGDLSENAEYHAAREIQGMTQAKIHQLQDELSRAYFVDLATLPKDSVVFGCTVRVKDLDIDEEEEFHLVGSNPDPDKNRILTTSPIGQGLLGKKKGDVVNIQVPRGTLHFEIVAIAPG
jgi:transcription elongation factor GreA